MNLRRLHSAFTLIELLTVIAIVGILAAIVGPSLTHFRKGDAMLAATRQMLDAVARARQLAISQHTTVYMVFVPTNFWAGNPAGFLNNRNLAERQTVTNVLEKQLTGYAYISLRSVGDQPGASTPKYLSQWYTLPETAFIPFWKFNLSPITTQIIRDNSTGQQFPVSGFSLANYGPKTPTIPFPSEDSAYDSPTPLFPVLPYIAFDYQGRLISGAIVGRDEYIPLAHGTVLYARNANKQPSFAAPSAIETPPNNSTGSSYQIIHIDALTGRARLERQEVQ